MKRFRTIVTVTLVALAVVAALGIAAWWQFGRSTGPNYAAILPTGPIDCPQDPDDLAGIEGWAPGAGKAEKIGQTGVGNVGGFGNALGGGSSATPTPNASPCTGLRGDVAARFDTIAAQIKLVPTGDFDPAVRGAEFSSVDSAFAFVRDAVHTEGYAGAMRGASGTLQSYSGSPADKALLLAALLGAEHVAVRFVHAQLSDSDTATVVAAVAAPAAPVKAVALDDAFKQLGVDAGQARANAAALRARVESAANGTIGAAKSASDDLVATLASKNVTLSKDDAALKLLWGANVRDHWWVQAQENGNWVDFDPTLPSAASGTHLGGAPVDAAVDALPDSAIATLTVRLTADRISSSGGAPATSTLVERTVKLTDAYAVPFIVSIGDRSAGADKVASGTSFTPAIAFAGNETTGNPFDANGLAVVRLQVESSQGGSVRHIASRIVYDGRAPNGTAIDPTLTPQRIAYALTNVYEILPVAGELSTAFAGMREAEGMQTLRALMAYAAAGGNGKQMPPPGIAETYPLQALHYFEYDALVRRLMEDGSGGAIRFSFDHPQVAIERHGFDASAATLQGIASFDIADNALLATGADHGVSVRANTTRGYVDTEAEQELFAGPNDGGTIALFEAAKKNGVALTVLQGDQYGGTALAPAQPVALGGRNRIGWWSVDPIDGNVVGRMGPDGSGQELTEYAIARANDWSTLYAMMQFYGDFFRCIAGGVEAPLSGGNAQAGLTGCFAAAICNYLEALTVGEAFSRWGTDEEALLYNILDLNVPGTGKASLPPTGGAACGVFQSPLYP